jgi:putative transposase
MRLSKKVRRLSWPMAGAYLSVIKDLYDGFIVTYRLEDQNSLALVSKTLHLALQKQKVTDGLILHSDRGHQYTSYAYFCLTQQYSILPSMSRPANCWDNAPIENFIGHLKEQLILPLHNPSFDELSRSIDDYVLFYNYERLQLKSKQTPSLKRCLFT